MNSFKADIIRAILFFGLIVYGLLLIKQIRHDNELLLQEQQLIVSHLQDSLRLMEEDIFFAIDIIEDLEQQKDSVQTLLNKERRKKQQVITVRDTIMVTPDGRNIREAYKNIVDQVEYFDEGVFEIEGMTSFKWDYMNNKPYENTFTIENFKLNLNVTTRLIPTNQGFEIDVITSSPSVNITKIYNNVLREEDFVKKVPTKLSIGIHGGYGLTNQGLTPYLGVGVTYNFIDVKAILENKRRKIFKTN